MAIREIRCYCRFGNVWDIIRSVLPILLLAFYDSRELQILVVLTRGLKLFYLVWDLFLMPSLPGRGHPQAKNEVV